MSDMQTHPTTSGGGVGQPPLMVVPVREATSSGPSFFGRLFRFLFLLAFILSVGLNLFLIPLVGSQDSEVQERFYLGKRSAQDKIAIIKMDGVIMEGMMGYMNKQIDKAGKDDNVKAVVLRINSPGGTITASDDLHHRLRELIQGNPEKKFKSKPVVVSMGSVAASGGYYIAAPAHLLMAERTTITGSIGVYAAFPNVAKLAADHGVAMDLIKRGEVKASGSMFHEMTPQERQVWQDMVDHAYDQFLAVVEEGRPQLKGKLRDDLFKPKEIQVRNHRGDLKNDGKPETVLYTRKLTDGGIFTADEALKYELIDKIGYLDDAVVEARKLGGVGDEYKAITYDRPQTFLNFLGVDISSRTDQPFDPNRLSSGTIPRLWFLAPQSELAGFLAAMGKE